MTISSSYAGFIISTRYEDLPPEVIQQAKNRILDLVGVSFAAYRLVDFPQRIVQYIVSLEGRPEATIVQTKGKYPAINASFANSWMAHSLDMDDGHRLAGVHPGTVIIPAALAAAESSAATTKELLAGVVAGYEVMIRIAMAINPSSLFRGFHTTGTVGTFGAAAAAANIMKLGLENTIGALGSAGLQSAGLMEVTRDDVSAMTKPINAAKAAMAGLLSAFLAQKGIFGPNTIFEGEYGFLRAVADKVDHEVLTANLGHEFEINNVYTKLHSSCRHTHAPIDGALRASLNSGIDIGEIRQIRIGTYPFALKYNKAHPSTPSAGRFSMPFSVALALTKGDASAARYISENIRDETIQNLAGKIEIVVEKKWEERYPKRRGATVSVIYNNGRVVSTDVDFAKGEPENPVTIDDIMTKFYANTTLLMSDSDARRLGNAIMKLEDISLSEFTGLLSRPYHP